MENSSSGQILEELAPDSPGDVPEHPNGTPNSPSSAIPRLELPWKPVLERLPEPIRKCCRMKDGRSFSFPAALLIDQLSLGVVKVSFAALKEAAPQGAFTASREFDHLPVELPLAEIVARLPRGGLARRPDQKPFEEPEDFTCSFAISKPTARTPSPAPARTAPQPVLVQVPPQSPLPPPEVLAPAVQPKPDTVVPVPESPKDPEPPKDEPIPFRMAQPEPMPKPEPEPLPGPKFESEPGSGSESKSEPAPKAGRLSVSLASVSKSWPDPVARLLSQSNAGERILELPIDELEEKLKQGKITFPWDSLRRWISPPLDATFHDPAEIQSDLELPLSVIAPLVLPHIRLTQRKKLAVSEGIPDLFTRQAAPDAADSRGNGSSQPAGQPVEPVPAPQAVPSLPEERWSPAQWVERTCGLPGVAGALLTTSDGLLVAGRLPEGWNPETLAAFVPQLFRRVDECAHALGIREMTETVVQTGEVPLHILQRAPVFLVAVGRAGQALPREDLAKLAARLSAAN